MFNQEYFTSCTISSDIESFSDFACEIRETKSPLWQYEWVPEWLNYLYVR